MVKGSSVTDGARPPTGSGRGGRVWGVAVRRASPSPTMLAARWKFLSSIEPTKRFSASANSSPTVSNGRLGAPWADGSCRRLLRLLRTPMGVWKCSRWMPKGTRSSISGKPTRRTVGGEAGAWAARWRRGWSPPGTGTDGWNCSGCKRMAERWFIAGSLSQTRPAHGRRGQVWAAGPAGLRRRTDRRPGGCRCSRCAALMGRWSGRARTAPAERHLDRMDEFWRGHQAWSRGGAKRGRAVEILGVNAADSALLHRWEKFANGSDQCPIGREWERRRSQVRPWRPMRMGTWKCSRLNRAIRV